MAKPPVVQAAGMLRAVGRGVDTTAWAWMCDQAGQMLFEPPNVAGWDDAHWIDTATFRARWQMAGAICNPARLDERTRRRKVPPIPRSWCAARPRSGKHALVGGHPRGARALRAGAMAAATQRWQHDSYPVLTENALRMLVAVSPDYLTA